MKVGVFTMALLASVPFATVHAQPDVTRQAQGRIRFTQGNNSDEQIFCTLT